MYQPGTEKRKYYFIFSGQRVHICALDAPRILPVHRQIPHVFWKFGVERYLPLHCAAGIGCTEYGEIRRFMSVEA